ncbi:MarR family winged helix-turn-helix transcriptional regulator [Actinomycetospora termitidis]|uniref:MarR family winged helix-turn-helix transcriptional regulator n=1 Tax=Actinomycetospora termitidis TaxID=3053470 RepID=A0ABT7M7M7_9PSEU|nr:MarR family winged helix-turn-helix transcriptional regulator [Actinomycetospora sp. Odt1-22]MDL5156683.1 MarR family winged helix-turn-helix transcriptional regulator [Actinomycetospora sp. Odt1-22]
MTRDDATTEFGTDGHRADAGDGARRPTTPEPLRAAPGFLVRRLYQAYSAAWLRHVDTTLTGPQFAVLTAVREYPEVDQGSLAASVALDRSTMADVCRRLEDRALIRRDTAPSDGRRKLLTLTDQGRVLLDDVDHRVCRLHDQLMGAATESDGFTRMLGDLDRLSERWERVAGGDGAALAD